MKPKPKILFIKHQVIDKEKNTFEVTRLDFEHNTVTYFDDENIYQMTDLKGQHFKIDGDWLILRYEV